MATRCPRCHTTHLDIIGCPTPTCGGCSGTGYEEAFVPVTRTEAEARRGTRLFWCDGCGGLIGQATAADLSRFVNLGTMQAEARHPEDLRYFDVDLITGRGRTHGWYDRGTRAVVQFG